MSACADDTLGCRPAGLSAGSTAKHRHRALQRNTGGVAPLYRSYVSRSRHRLAAAQGDVAAAARRLVDHAPEIRAAVDLTGGIPVSSAGRLPMHGLAVCGDCRPAAAWRLLGLAIGVGAACDVLQGAPCRRQHRDRRPLRGVGQRLHLRALRLRGVVAGM